MKKLCILLILLLVFGMTACVPGEPAQTTAAAQPPAPEVTAPRSEALTLPDFSVQCADGTVFTLSEALKDHELVLINLFATWCPPCRMEFPYLQDAWTQRSDKVAVVALSVEPTDDAETLRGYADELGLSFPIGSEDGTGLRDFATEGIPTSLLIDRTGRVAAVEIGAKTSTEAFLDWFDGFTGEQYDPEVCTYTVLAYDAGRYTALPGVVFNFCTDTTCTPVVTAQSGVAVFTGPPARYHVQLVQTPEGFAPLDADEWTTEPYAQTFQIPFAEVSK